MYCPRCSVQNTDDARFCRSCGTDISLVPQALTGRLPEAEHLSSIGADEDNGRSGRCGKRRKKAAPTVEKAIESIFMGAAFLIIFLAGLIFFRRGFMIWVWFIIPALACAGQGVGQLLRAKHERQQRQLPPTFEPAAGTMFSPAPRRGGGALPHRAVSELGSPPTSVTEGTTRHLDALGAPGTRDTSIER